ncbi:MAG: PilT/PilU family type 4a pilus ATPase [Candidatus Sumerlaeales bacterium]|nr:PilT/PilU family type 4a pilus ATPase [Candidatus Sumerlaeales bacterium]
MSTTDLDIDKLLLVAKKMRASDVHMLEGERIAFRIDGDLHFLQLPPFDKKTMLSILHKMMPTHLSRELESQRGSDFAYQIGSEIRFRCVAYYSTGKLGLIMRLIPLNVPTIEELELPEVTRRISLEHRGMVLITGMTGSGKSTTLAAMINFINQTDSLRIITIEDPIEYVYKSEMSFISQREIGRDVPDFNVALRQAMRMDPDVILVGEMRDVETIRVAIKAAETGHLVFSTLHTTSAVHTVQRIIGYFPQNEHALLREQLSLNMRASVTQRLVKRCDTPGRLAAMEIMVVNATISKLIYDDRIPDCFTVITSRDDGMQSFDQALADLVRNKNISYEEGQLHCEDEQRFKRFVQGVSSSGDRGGIIG